MASKTAQSELRRKIRHQNMNPKARRARANKGTTPAFPVHTPQADANAQEKSKE